MKQLSILLAGVLVAGTALAQVTVVDPWIRATVPAQTSSGAYMRVSSKQDARLVGVRTPVAGNAQLHQMEMQGHSMKMHAVDAIALPAGKVVDLASSGYHVMLFDLKRQLKEGESVPLTLVVEDAKHKRSDVTVNVPVKPLGFAPAH